MHFQSLLLTTAIASTSLAAPVALNPTSPGELAGRAPSIPDSITSLSPPAGTETLPGPVETIPLLSPEDIGNAEDLVSHAVEQAAPLLEHEAWKEYKRFVARLRKLLGHKEPLDEREVGQVDEQHEDDEDDEDGEYDLYDSLALEGEGEEEGDYDDEKWEL